MKILNDRIAERAPPHPVARFVRSGIPPPAAIAARSASHEAAYEETVPPVGPVALLRKKEKN
ncbi:MAG: hypothetical protein WD490_09735 [Opitutales bacterium]